MKHEDSGPIAWFIRNPVAANILVIFILLTGLLSYGVMKKELLPKVPVKNIYISAGYPMASPSEVEQGITVKIEDAVRNIGEIKKIQSYSSIGSSYVQLELDESASIDGVMNEVKAAVDAISTFPNGTQDIGVTKTKPYDFSLAIQIHGKIDEAQAKRLANDLRREMLTDTIIRRADIIGTRPYEIAVEVSEEQLQKYGVTMSQVANRIRMESVNAPGGVIKTENGNILIKVEGKANSKQEIENIILLTTEQGVVVRVADVANVFDGFVDNNYKSSFDDEYSIGLAVSAFGQQDVVKIAEAAKAFVEKKRSSLPEGVKLTTWVDTTYYFKSRMETMYSNLMYGALLVFLLLILFMDFKTAFWVMAGLPLSFAGAMILMSFGIGEITLNMVSMFGFIIVVGILVDDAIVVAESVDTEVRKNGLSRMSVLNGTRKVAVPVIFGVLTTVVAFMPMLFQTGSKQNFMFAIGFVVCACLLFSLVEAMWVLPSHLEETMSGKLRFFRIGWQEKLQLFMNRKLEKFVGKLYLPMVRRAIEKRYVTAALFLAALVLSKVCLDAGIIKYQLFPPEPSDYITTKLSMAKGVSDKDARKALQKIEDGIHLVEKQYQKEFSTDSRIIDHLFTYGSETDAFFVLELTKADDRMISSFEVVDRWRKVVGDIEGATVLDFSGSGVAGSEAMSFFLVGGNAHDIEGAAEELKEKLQQMTGVYQVSNTVEKGRQEYKINLKPKARSLNLTLSDIASQMMNVFYGVEALKLQRDEEIMKVMVRYPESQRESIMDLENMHIRVPDGRLMRLRELADIEIVYAASTIIRVNGQLAVYVSGKINNSEANPGEIISIVNNQLIPELMKKYPTIKTQLSGINEEEQSTEAEIRHYFLIALMAVFVLLAIPLKSYFQPMIIMSVIPFGLVGAIWGHWLLGYPVSMMSMFGLIALTGVVVNDSLVMVDFVNRAVREEGMDVKEAATQAGGLRFRAIMLTTITTFAGVLPIITETSIQASSMIPMAISIGFGIMFATLITLFLIPCLYVVLEDIKKVFFRLIGKTVL